MTIKSLNRIDQQQHVIANSKWINKKKDNLERIRERVLHSLSEDQWNKRLLTLNSRRVIPRQVAFRKCPMPIIYEGTIIRIAFKHVSAWNRKLFDVFYYCVPRVNESQHKATGVIPYNDISREIREEISAQKRRNFRTSLEVRAFCEGNLCKIESGIEELREKYDGFFREFYNSLFLLHKSTIELAIPWNEDIGDREFYGIKVLGDRVSEKRALFEKFIEDPENGLREDWSTFKELIDLLSSKGELLRGYYAQKKDNSVQEVVAPNLFGEKPLRISKSSPRFHQDCVLVENLYSLLPRLLSKNSMYVRTFIHEVRVALCHLKELNADL